MRANNIFSRIAGGFMSMFKGREKAVKEFVAPEHVDEDGSIVKKGFSYGGSNKKKQSPIKLKTSRRRMYKKSRIDSRVNAKR